VHVFKNRASPLLPARARRVDIVANQDEWFGLWQTAQLKAAFRASDSADVRPNFPLRR
jgi:hypothetical protein